MQLSIFGDNGSPVTPRKITGGFDDFTLSVGTHYSLVVSGLTNDAEATVQTLGGKTRRKKSRDGQVIFGFTCRTAKNGLFTVQAGEETETLMFNTDA